MSDNLNITDLAAGLDNPEVPVNTANGELDAAITETATVGVTDSNAASVTQATLERAVFLQLDPSGSPGPTAAITITVATFKRGLFVVFNNTSFDATVEISGQSADSPIVTAGDTFTLHSDGSNVRLAGGGGGSSGYDVMMAHGGGSPPGSSEIITTIPIVREVTFPADFAGSVGNIETNPTATFDIDVQDDGSSIGTISISTGGVFTFATVSNTQKVVAAGSILTFVAPMTTDATAADMVATLLGSV